MPLISQKQLQELYLKNLTQTKEDLRKSVGKDQLIMQTIANLSELEKVSNLLSKRLREWYSWYFPELSEEVSNHEFFVRQIISGVKKSPESMGAELQKEDLEEIQSLARLTESSFNLRETHQDYLKKLMSQYCPNLLELAGVTIAAHLIALAKSLKHLALLPASTIQLLGAEKALFRHIKTGSRSPKYGILFQHPLVQKSKPKERGKIARALADKLSLCARLDYFQGEFKAPHYKKELEDKFEES